MKWLIGFCIFISILSQIQPIEYVTRPLMYASWPFACFYYLIAFKGKLNISKFTKYYSVIYLLFILYCLLCYLLGADNLKSTHLSLLYIPLMLCVLADCCAPCLTQTKFQYLLRVYFVTALIFAVWVHITYFPSYSSWRGSMVYDFAQKNSAAQIWGAAILVNMFLIQYKTKLWKYVGTVLNFYLVWLILVSHCRTALLGLGVVLVWNIIAYSKHKIGWIIIGLVGLQCILYIPAFRDMINHSLLLTKYEGADADAFSSGRLGLYQLAWQDFLSSPLIGVGKYYVDCSYISTLTENGIIGFVLIESIWLYKVVLHLVYAIKDKLYQATRVHSAQAKFLISITLFYLVESALEGYPPFGPGVSAMAFWLFSAMLLNRRKGQETLV